MTLCVCDHVLISFISLGGSPCPPPPPPRACLRVSTVVLYWDRPPPRPTSAIQRRTDVSANLRRLCLFASARQTVGRVDLLTGCPAAVGPASECPPGRRKSWIRISQQIQSVLFRYRATNFSLSIQWITINVRVVFSQKADEVLFKGDADMGEQTVECRLPL